MKYRRNKFVRQDLISIRHILKRIIFKCDAKPEEREEAQRLLVQVDKALNITLGGKDED